MSTTIIFSIEGDTQFFRDPECRVLKGTTTEDYDTPAQKLVGAALFGGQLHVQVKNIGWMEARELKLAVSTSQIMTELHKHKSDLKETDLPTGWRNK